MKPVHERQLRIASVVFSYYPSDSRPRREAEALIETGMSVDVICLKGEAEGKEEQVNGVNVFRLSVTQSRKGKMVYLWEYGWFILLAFFKLWRLQRIRRYDLVHVHNMPDVLVFCTLLPRLQGAKILLDLHDPMPEIYMTKYNIGESHIAIRLLRFFERLSILFAHGVITPNIAFRDLFISRGCPESKINIVMNSPQENIFKQGSHPLIRTHSEMFVIMYHGFIAERNGLATALEAIHHIRREIPNLQLEVYGEGDFLKTFLETIEELNLQKIIHYYGSVPQEIIAQAIQTINVGIIPNRMTPFTNLNFPMRIFEYLSMGKPVIAPRTKGILDYFDEESLHFFEPGNVESLKNVILDIYRSPSRNQIILKRGINIYNKHKWQSEKDHFINLIINLLQ